jgi:conjugative transfer signal peptidase TraF
VGLYYWTDVPIKKGSIVLFKPDQSTPLQQLGINRGYEARKLPKRVVALAGDVVSVSSSGVSINGQLLPNSAPLFRDEAGRPLTMAQLDHFGLGIDQAFLMGVTPTSWDSRYFGPVPLSRCSGSFVPVLTWPWGSAVVRFLAELLDELLERRERYFASAPELIVPVEAIGSNGEGWVWSN